MDIEYVPTANNPATTIGFIQVVRQYTLDGKPVTEGWPKATLEFRMKSNVDKNLFDHLDILSRSTDPYYNMEWGTKWDIPANSNYEIGNGPSARPAYMNDSPSDPVNARKGKDLIIEFETAVFSVDSQEILGVIRWGFKVPGSKDGRIELLDATQANVSLTASDQFKKIVEKANAIPEIKHAQLDGSAKITKPNAKKFGGTSAIPN